MSTPPVPYKTPLTGPDGLLTVPWQAWFRQLFLQVGGNNSTPLTNPMTTAGDIIYGATSGAASRLAGNLTTSKQFLSQTGTGSASTAPSWATLSGSDLPNPSASTLGGVESFAAVSNQWINAISTSGVPSGAQPAFSNISGNLATAQLPTALTWASSGTVLACIPNQYGVLLSGSGATATVLAPDSSTNKALVSGGASANPSWALLSVAGGGTGVATLTTNGILYGNGSSAVAATAAGTQYQVFQVGASGVPTVGALNLGQSAAITGNLPVTNLNSGTSASSSTYWRGDGTWAAVSGAGTVTSVQVAGANGLSFTGGPVTGSGTITAALTGPTQQIFTAAPTGVTNYSFTITSHAFIKGDTYTNNGHTYTVLSASATSTTLICSGNGTPGASGTLTWASGSGSGNITFSAFNGAYVLPSNPAPLWIKVTAVGGGAGAGISGANPGGGSGGGGGGGGSIAFINSPSSLYSWTVGAGGASAVAGGTSSFGTSLCSATGGAVGAGGGTNPVGFGGGLGGVGSFGTINLYGGPGGTGSSSIAGTAFGTGGAGGNGASQYGGGGANALNGSAGIAASGYGGGGSGACGGANSGGAGSGGIIVVEEYYI